MSDEGGELLVQETHDHKTEYHFSADVHRRAHHGFTIHSATGQGRGVFATRDFAQGALLVSEPPLPAVDVPMTRQHAAKDLDQMVGYCSVDSHAQMCSLMQHAGKHGAPRQTSLGVWQSNALPSHDVSGGASIYADACRYLRHSCSPSLEQTFDPDMGRRLHVTHPEVLCGDQLFISYDKEPGTRAERRERLFQRFGFQCECRLCSLVGIERVRSDERQERMCKLRAYIFDDDDDDAVQSDAHGTAAGPRDPRSVISAVDEMLALQRSEGLPITWGRECMIVAMKLCQSQGDTPAASRFAWDAAETIRIGGGVQLPIYGQLLKIAARSPPTQRLEEQRSHARANLNARLGGFNGAVDGAVDGAADETVDDGLNDARRVAWAAMLEHARAMVDCASAPPAPAATCVSVHILEGLLGSSEIIELHNAAAASVAEQRVWPRRRHTPAGAHAHDVRYSDEHVALFLHCDRYLETRWPRIYATLVGSLRAHAHAQGLGWLGVRCIELHRYEAEGGYEHRHSNIRPAARPRLSPLLSSPLLSSRSPILRWSHAAVCRLFDSTHRDMGSIVTMSVLLTEPHDMVGGEMVTWTKGILVKHHLGCGDAIVFHSEARHNVARVVHGVRHSLVVELWDHPTNTHLNRYG